MGEQKVSQLNDTGQMQEFMKHLLHDVQALEHMLENDMFESGIKRIGAEQEMCLVDKYWKPANNAMDLLKDMKQHDWVETELARFNLETNLKPRTFTGNCLSKMENELNTNLGIIREVSARHDTEILLTGIMPTLRKSDLGMHNLTPKKRYAALMNAINSQLNGRSYELRLRGIDELLVKHDSPLLEACNTSFQVHLQIEPRDFVKMYNIAQLISAPVMAIAANSPILFGKRLWHETRIALFQQALDTRSTHEHLRERSPRVTFGTEWLQDSILEIYKEDIARFRVLLSSDVQEDAFQQIADGKVPNLKALQVHNGTVYRWNRPCYGIGGGVPHLRIECRVLPAGPSVIDEMANAALWLGAMEGLALRYEDVSKEIGFADVRDNFVKAARTGIDSKFTWFGDKKIGACDLILEELIPIAREGLEAQNVDKADIDRYMGVIEGRAKKHMNGARWALRGFTSLAEKTNKDEAVTILTAMMIQNQKNGLPVHEWKEPDLEDLEKYEPYNLLVEEFMGTDLFTVQKDDIIELVTDMMDWRKIRYMPVEDGKGHLEGLITSQLLLKHFSNRKHDYLDGEAPTMVKEIMIKNPVTVSPGTTIGEALILMEKHKTGCLLVVNNDELAGIITEMNFLQITSRLIKRFNTEVPHGKTATKLKRKGAAKAVKKTTKNPAVAKKKTTRATKTKTAKSVKKK